jgi:DNA mismatch repair protein MutL
MDREDAMLCLEAHATSKVNEVYDIDRIATLGFRGEALPSIAGVSRFTLQTRRHDEPVGTEAIVDGGRIRDIRECGCACGTSVLVRNLFFNLPARKKFLRRPVTEAAHLQEVVLMQSLAHRNIAFELELDGRMVLHSGGRTDLGTRIGLLLGRELRDGMVEVTYEENDVKVHGFVARPGVTRKNRREQRFFVNGRPAEAPELFHALRDAYHTLVMKGRYAPAVLYISVPAEDVDVNVHPSKREVRFRRGGVLRQVVSAAVRRALRDTAAGSFDAPFTPPKPKMPTHIHDQPEVFQNPTQQALFEQSTPQSPTADQNSQPQQVPNGVPTHTADSGSENQTSSADAGQSVNQPVNHSEQASETSLDEPIQPSDADNATDKNTGQNAEHAQTTPENEACHIQSGKEEKSSTSVSVSTYNEITQLRVFGDYKRQYLVAEGSSGLVLIDQHAAHERILFERLLEQARQEKAMSQQLLIPATVEVGPREAEVLNKHLEELLKIGFRMEPFGGNAFVVTGVPPDCPSQNISGLIADITEDLLNAGASRHAGIEQREIRVAQAACKHAVKAHDRLGPEEVDSLLEQLGCVEMPFTCPHGRPVMINIPDSELDKRFGRRQ